MEQEEGIGFFAVLQGKDGAAEAGPYKFAGCAAGGAASAGHAFEHIWFNGSQGGKSSRVCFVQVYSGTGADGVAEFIHVVRCFFSCPHSGGSCQSDTFLL